MVDPNRSDDRRPTIVGYQRWAQLTFIHWRIPVMAVRPHIPQSLEIDTWEGDAWLGIVAFEMSQVRPWWSPALPYISAFPETNLRTYVRLPGHDPGVWFFSLDASRLLAVLAARWGWGLNYYWSHMQVSRCAQPSSVRPASGSQQAPNAPQELHYRSHRWGTAPAHTDVRVHVESGQPQVADQGSLEYFLCERYVLFCQNRRGALVTGRVHHQPYALLPAKLTHMTQTLTDRMGCPLARPPEHVVFSPGVNVRISPLQPAE